MIRENKIFHTERMEYQQMMETGGIYNLGTFIPKDMSTINNNFVQMVPTKNSELMFDTVRENFGYIPFHHSFEKDPTVYTASGKTSMVLVDQIYGVTTHITNIATEFLDNVGIYVGTHSIRLVELTETEDTYYYVMVGGKGAIEAKADELYNAGKISGNDEPFQLAENQDVLLDGTSMVHFVLAMVNDSFGCNWTMADTIDAKKIFGITTPHSYDMGELDCWKPLEGFESWTDPARLGLVLSIKKGI